MSNLTESYCERCGAHYVFEAEAPKPLSIKSARVLAKGLRNFVMNDGQSLGDSMALARHEESGQTSGRVTEAFHKAFNFCMTCRQYACESCWNPKQGACLTCAPDPELSPIAHETHLLVRTPATHFGTEAELGPEATPGWPSADLEETPPPATAFGAMEEMPAATTPQTTPHWLARSVSSDGEAADQQRDAWTQWPLADPLAPEATLTAEELSMVRSNLPADEEVAPQPAPPLTRTQRQDPAAARAAAAAAAAAAASAAAAARVEPLAEPAASPAVPDLTSAAPSTPPEPPAQPVGSDEGKPIAARLFGHFGHPAQGQKPAVVEPAQSLRGTPSSDPWPHVTRWADRPTQSSTSTFASDPGPAEASATPFLPVEATAAAAAPAFEPATGLAPTPEPELAAQATAAPSPQEPASPPVEPWIAAPAQPAPEPRQLPQRQSWPEQGQLPLPAAAADAGRPSVFEPAAGMAIRRPAASPSDPIAATARPAPAPTPAAPPQPEPLEPAKAPVYVDRAAPMWPGMGGQWTPQQQPNQVWPAPTSAVPSPAVLSARTAAPATPSAADVWAQSSQPVLTSGSVRVCHHCGLPLSTHARFCRRCGTSQQ
jgi:hypothetical protein